MLFALLASFVVAISAVVLLVCSVGMLFPHPKLPNLWVYYARMVKPFYAAPSEERPEWEIRPYAELLSDLNFRSVGHRLLVISVLRLGTSFLFTCGMLVICCSTFVFEFLITLDMMSRDEIHVLNGRRMGVDYLFFNVFILLLFVAAKTPLCH